MQQHPRISLGGSSSLPSDSKQKPINWVCPTCVAWRLWRPVKQFLKNFQKPETQDFTKRNDAQFISYTYN